MRKKYNVYASMSDLRWVGEGFSVKARTPMEALRIFLRLAKREGIDTPKYKDFRITEVKYEKDA